METFGPAKIDATTFLEVTAYVLQMNGALAGEQELTASTPVPVDAVVGTRKIKTAAAP